MDNANVGMPEHKRMYNGKLPKLVISRFFLNRQDSQGSSGKEVKILVKINGEERPVQGQTVADYLEKTGYCRTRVAVEKNGEILPKAEYDSTVLEDGDVIEVVSFVGGG